MKPELSIIIPCYNSAKTLEEAVDSIFRQNLQVPFEIVMVDDHSTDETRALMERLEKEHPEIKLFFHQSNLGGGAARNTAVQNSKSELVFCLDSDDILGDNTLPKMVAMIKEKNADGIGISTSIKFKGRDRRNVAFTNEFGHVGEKIPFDVLFQENELCSLYSTFLHTKKAFEIAGGYPIDHGFDTQAFAFRFLANGLVAYTCPETIYWHRINFNKSYYIREYEAGKINYNWFKIYEEFLYLFSDELKDKMFSFNLNDEVNFLNKMVESYKNKLADNYRSWIKPNSKELYKDLLSSAKQPDKYDYYWLGNEALRKNDFKNAIPYFSQAKEKGLNDRKIDLKILESNLRMKGKTRQEIEVALSPFVNYRLQGSRAPILRRLFNKIRRILK